MHRNQNQARTYAVKVNDDEGWVGVSDIAGRCHGHGHETPEQAKLCALHRAHVAGADDQVLLMPVPEPAPPKRRRAAR